MVSNSNNNFSVVRLSGGLGNQLFQLGFAISTEIKMAEPVYLDTINYRKNLDKINRELALKSILGANALLINSGSLLRQVIGSIESTRIRGFIDRNEEMFLKNRFKKLTFSRQAPCIFDEGLSYEPSSNYIGSFTSPQYWGEHQFLILQKVTSLLSSFSSNSSPSHQDGAGVLAIHARRGDYVTNLKTNSVHGSYGLSYYIESVRLLLESGHNPSRIIISSDSLDFSHRLAQGLSKEFQRIQILDSNNLIDLMLALSEADYFIGSNSTFSWWVAHLRVRAFSILPLIWFRGNDFNFKHSEYFLFKPHLLHFDFDS
jgi:hypothetical protein